MARSASPAVRYVCGTIGRFERHCIGLTATLLFSRYRGHAPERQSRVAAQAAGRRGGASARGGHSRVAAGAANARDAIDVGGGGRETGDRSAARICGSAVRHERPELDVHGHDKAAVDALGFQVAAARPDFQRAAVVHAVDVSFSLICWAGIGGRWCACVNTVCVCV